jgi:hypothetical protein
VALERLLRKDATLEAPPLRTWYAGSYLPCGIVVLTATAEGISRITNVVPWAVAPDVTAERHIASERLGPGRCANK